VWWFRVVPVGSRECVLVRMREGSLLAPCSSPRLWGLREVITDLQQCTSGQGLQAASCTVYWDQGSRVTCTRKTGRKMTGTLHALTTAKVLDKRLTRVWAL
jgi:hypothetical protein